MLGKVRAVSAPLLSASVFTVSVVVCTVLMCVPVSADTTESESTPTATATARSQDSAKVFGSVVKTQQPESFSRSYFLRNYLEIPDAATEYSLFRSHSERYYPLLDVEKATRLSLFMPGLGQAYAGNAKRGTLFLAAELGAFAFAGYHLARALHYNDQDGFETGFQDARTDVFLTPAQSRTRMESHAVASGVFLLTGIGVHIWNVIDASRTAESANEQRFTVHVEQESEGLRSLIFRRPF